MVENRFPKNIFLIGFMGAGKTSVARMLAKKLQLSFCDLDETIEKELGMKIPEIFSTYGEDFFRDAESKVLRSVAQRERQVIATGGGVVLREENWEVMEKKGVTIYLKAPAVVLYNRVKDNTSRPLLQVENPFDKVKELLSKRMSLYEKADLIVDTEHISPQEVVREIRKKLMPLVS
ncbi:MAG: shikimate kinase [Deltaproteobacteria bacterium]|nr:shikimate kinase [Deltaproteobacteria bacterium]